MLIRVQKIIADSGHCSRRKAEELIIEGIVYINKEKAKIGDKANPKKDVIRIKNLVIKQPKKVYLIINKPKGYITTNSDLYSRKKVIDLINIKERIYPVGRLDRDATGLLLLTNDGEWGNKIMHPKNNIDKEYHAKLDKPISKEIIQKMNKGFKLSDGFIKPKIRSISKNYCYITIHEGKNKIVKRIFNHFNFRVIQLKRTKIGFYKLGRLKPGEWRHIKP